VKDGFCIDGEAIFALNDDIDVIIRIFSFVFFQKRVKKTFVFLKIYILIF